MEELLNCPFCELLPDVWFDEEGDELISCRTAGCILQDLVWSNITTWNTRPSPWIKITPETMPETGKLVYITWVNDCKRRMVVVGYWTPRWKEESSGEDEAYDEYSDQDDKYYMKEGWYEQQVNWGDWASIYIHDGKPDFYQPIVMPIPPIPKEN